MLVKRMKVIGPSEASVSTVLPSCKSVRHTTKGQILNWIYGGNLSPFMGKVETNDVLMIRSNSQNTSLM